MVRLDGAQQLFVLALPVTSLGRRQVTIAGVDSSRLLLPRGVRHRLGHGEAAPKGAVPQAPLAGIPATAVGVDVVGRPRDERPDPPLQYAAPRERRQVDEKGLRGQGLLLHVANGRPGHGLGLFDAARGDAVACLAVDPVGDEELRDEEALHLAHVDHVFVLLLLLRG